MVQTITVYLFTYTISVYLAKRAESTNIYRKRRMYIVLLITALSLLAGLRRHDIGLDTSNYVTYFSSGFTSYGGIENGYKVLTFFLMSIYKNYTFGLSVIAFLTNIFFVARFWSLRKLSPFSNSIFVYFPMLYFSTFSGIRQLLAISLVFCGTYFIYDRKNYLFFFVLLFFAVNLHRSSLISLLYFFPLIFVKKHSIKEILKQVFFFVLLPIGGYYAYFSLINTYGNMFYSTGRESASLGIMLPVRMLLLICILLDLFVKKRYYEQKKEYMEYENNDKEHEKKDKMTDNKEVVKTELEVKHLCFFELLSLSTSYLYYISSAMSRIGWYFAPFTPVLYGYNMKNATNYRSLNAAIRIISILIPLYYFYSSIISKTNGLAPYYFFWQ